ncbi:ABC transporter substrate-binding protein [Falsiroseomonas selenitidurans]|uniref:ABC transporter substrate-binding protein n=1 Tax=Falsiroseomonas selenitidurans TaxID=2716335 RepID=A0ABX1E8J9_9PROT|nr:ABC transporter substrate-binding protein [Falsiroseomonas selenitidurans]NKC33545.1 ABC transporter substrate-binding protein [Falsiroseomonas selenitidurans]
MSTIGISRRGALALPALFGLAATTRGAHAQGGLKRVRIAVGTTNLNLAYPWLTLPVALGWWQEAGYAVEVLPVGASLQALQQMVAGNAEFAQLNSSVVIQANVQNNIPVRAVMNNGVIDWSLSVLEDGPVKTVADLKGKTIGVFSLATGGIAFLRSYLRAAGMNPDSDVRLVPVGLGAPPIEALRNNRVQALLYWASAQAGFQNAGLKLRHLRGEDWQSYPDFTFSTLQKTIEADPAMVEAIARGCARATEFVMASPDCQRRLHWARWPSTRPTGADEATLAQWDLNNLEAQLGSMHAAHAMNGGQLWGRATPEAYGRIQTFMQEAGLIQRSIDPATYMVSIPDFYTKINNFDAAATRALAAACPAT